MTVECKIEGCEKLGNGGRGMCYMHYKRFQKHGDPNVLLMKRNLNVLGYIEETIIPYDGDDCIFWPFSKVNGYGKAFKNGKLQLVSRIVCEFENGPPPTKKHHAAHSCGNGHLACCNRRHLSWKTPAENTADKIIHGTYTSGEKSHTAKISEEDAKIIISLKGKEPQRKTADRFGISQSNVSYIQSGSTWVHLQNETEGE